MRGGDLQHLAEVLEAERALHKKRENNNTERALRPQEERRENNNTTGVYSTTEHQRLPPRKIRWHRFTMWTGALLDNYDDVTLWCE